MLPLFALCSLLFALPGRPPVAPTLPAPWSKLRAICSSLVALCSLPFARAGRPAGRPYTPCSELPALCSDLRHFHPLLHRRPGSDRIVPTFHVGKILEVDLMNIVPPHPGIGRDVGDRIFSGKKFFLVQLLV